MSDTKEFSVFLDTSIRIARMVHGPQTKTEIKARIDKHDKSFSSLIARQEFKRRLMKEADYLMRLLHQYDSFDEVSQHVIRLPNKWPKLVRKRNICLQTLSPTAVVATIALTRTSDEGTPWQDDRLRGRWNNGPTS